jgi:hypothetical protein
MWRYWWTTLMAGIRGPFSYTPEIADKPPWFAPNQIARCNETGEYFRFDPVLNTLSKVEMPPAPERHYEVDFYVPEQRLPTIWDAPAEPPPRPRSEVIPFRPPAARQGEVLHLRHAPPVAATAAERRLYRELSPSPRLSSPQIDQAMLEFRHASAQIESQKSYPNPYRRAE